MKFDISRVWWIVDVAVVIVLYVLIDARIAFTTLRIDCASLEISQSGSYLTGFAEGEED